MESLAVGGEGIARRGGKVCFVPGALPGERVLGLCREHKRSYDRFSLTRVLRTSPDRVLPLCPHLALCGGCTLQTLRYEAQLQAKAGQVRDCLSRIGKLEVPEPAPPLPSPLLTGYRNKMEFTFAPRAWLADGPPSEPAPSPALGLHVPGRYDAVFDLEECALPSPQAVHVLRATRRFAREEKLAAWRSQNDEGLLRHLIVREGKNTGDLLVGLVVRRGHPALADLAGMLAQEIPRVTGVVALINEKAASVARGDEEQVLSGRPFFEERLLRLTFRLQLQSFFQTNTWGAEVLLLGLRQVLGGRGGGRVLDLYCGAGTLGLAAADLFQEIVGVDSVEGSILDARRNAERNGITHAAFHAAPAEDWLVREAGRFGPFSGVLVDPPRAGLHPRAARGLGELAPAWILYVSCNPATLARDAALLVEAGYRAVSLQIVDLFPHTAHIESILLLERV